MQPSKGVVTQATSPALEPRHYPSGFNSCFIGTPATFSEYIEYSRKLIAQSRSGNDLTTLNKIVDGNAPFELKPVGDYPVGKEKPYLRGILLTHGLTDSPYYMRHLAVFFQEQGFRVMVLLLPGHGTQPGDLLNVHWQDWAKMVEYGVGQLALEVEEIYLGGYSAGGALSIYHSLRDQRIRGLFLFAPALQISAKAAFANVHKTYSWLAPSAKWLSIKPDLDRYKYESFPKNAAAQMHALTRVLQKRLAGQYLKIPIFAAVSQDDATVNSAATIKFMEHSRHSANKLVYYFSDPENIPTGLGKDKIEFVNSVLSEQGIHSSAHTAIMLPRDDEYYGEQGIYCSCHHYYPAEMDKYLACIERVDSVIQGEISEKHLKQGTLRRLTYNPNFAGLKSSLKQFIGSIST